MEQEELFDLQDRMEDATDEERMTELLKHFPEFKLNTARTGTDSRGANKYRVTIKNGSLKFTTTFTDSLYNTYNHKPSSKMDILYCVLMDAQCYDNYDNLEDFADNFGYDLYEERGKAKKVFYGCERAYDSITELFGTDGYEILNCLTYGM
jgi:hypothetical protein